MALRTSERSPQPGALRGFSGLTLARVSLILALTVTTLMGCEGAPTEPTSSGSAPSTEALGAAERADVPSTPAKLPSSFDVSYANSRDWLETLPREVWADQVRDWIVLGLASQLDLDALTLRDSTYDKTPVRDAAFDDLASNRVGPGRSLFDGAGTLHVLIADADPYPSRTIGYLLDDYRANSGADPKGVRVHSFETDTQKWIATVRTGARVTADEVRAQHGYMETRIRTPQDLQGFLSRTQHLSRVRRDDEGLIVAGWSWDGVPGAKVTPDDLAVLQHGYELAAQGLAPDPGFSLDPADPVSLMRLLEIVDERQFPEVPEILSLLEVVESSDGPESRSAAVEAARLIQENQTLMFVFQRVHEGDPSYQHARYDGPLRGTAVGMTYFYTDIVAKAWPMELGSGGPVGVVPGFVSDVDATVPWGHCKATISESGRLWFGLKEDGLSPRKRRVDFGSRVARLFTKVEDPTRANQEIEPSYSFGRVMWWWDRNYVAMADYEPEYHRLDQLMRWGAAIAWMIDSSDFRFPAPNRSEVNNEWTLSTWMAAKHGDLKWDFEIPYVHPGGSATESLLILRSPDYENCGRGGYWSGGVSAPELRQLTKIRTQRPNVSGAVARTGLSDTATTYSASTRSGVIGNSVIKRSLPEANATNAQVRVTANGRRVWSMSRLKAWIPEATPRKLELTLRRNGNSFTQELSVQGRKLGELQVASEASFANVTWRPGILARARRALQSVQDTLPGRPLQEAVTQSRSSLAMADDSGSALVRVDAGRESRWIKLEPAPEAPSGSKLAFRLGAPGDDGPVFYQASFADAPKLQSEWMVVQSRGPGVAGGVGGSGPPPANARRLTAGYADDPRRGSLHIASDRPVAKADDPIFGLEGTGEGRALFDKTVLDEVLTVEDAAQRAGDPYLRGVRINDETLGLVDRDGLILVGRDSTFHRRVAAALDVDGSTSLFKIHDDVPVVVKRTDVQRMDTPMGPVELDTFIAELKSSGGVSTRGPPVFIEKGLADRIALVEGRIPPDAIGDGWQVRLATLGDETPAATPERVAGFGAAPRRGSSDGGPPIRFWDDSEWLPIAASTAGQRGSRDAYFVFADDDCDDEEHERDRCQDS